MGSINLWSRGVQRCLTGKSWHTSRLTLADHGRLVAPSHFSTASPGESTDNGALRDIKVLDLSRVLAVRQSNIR